MLLILGTNFSIFSYLLISLLFFSSVHECLLIALDYVTMTTSTPPTTENLLTSRCYMKVFPVIDLLTWYNQANWDVLDRKLLFQVTQ